MRRLWSYIILACTSLVLMGVTFSGVFKKSTSNIEYSDGREMVFRISEKDESELDETNEDGKTPAEIISKNMMERLDSLKVTNYVVNTESYDTVKITLKQDENQNYQNVKRLMTFDGSLALSSKLDDFIVNNEEGEKFINGKAYVETKNEVYPTVNIPVSDAFYNLLEIVKGYKTDGKTEASEAAQEEGGEATYNLYLWHDYVDGDTYEKVSSSKNPDIAEKIFMSFDVSQIEDDAKTLTAYININGANEEGSTVTARDVRKAYSTANYYVSLINSGALDYKVTCLYERNVDAITERLVDFGDGPEILAWSSTLRATLVCILIISLLLFLFFRLGALSVATLSLGSVYAAVGSIILFTAEFNAAGLIALCAVAIVSLFSGCLYLTKLKEETYRGRTLKKANTEASKKSLLPIIDFNVVLIIVGIFSFLFGGALMRSFSIIAVVGGLASLLLNTLGLKGMMWLATNTTKLQGKYEAFGIDGSKVPNVLNEEKQTYFGAYAEKDFTKKKTPVAIIASIMFVAGVTCMIVFGALNKGVVYNNGSSTLNSEILISLEKTETTNITFTEEKVRSVLANTFTYTDDEEKAKSLESQVNDIIRTEDSKVVGEGEEEKTITTVYYIVQLNTKIDNSEKNNAYYVEFDAEGKEIGAREYSKDLGTISDLLTEKLGEGISDLSADLKGVKTVSAAQPNFANMIWGTWIAIAVSSLYFILRYRLSRGLATFVLSTMTTGLIAGFFAYARFFAVTSYAAVTIPVIALFTLLMAIIFMNKEREMVLEDKNHDNSIENRNAIMIKANSLSYTTVLLLSVLTVYICINFFGFGAAANAWLFLILGVSVAIVALLSTTLLGPISQFFFKLFSKVNISKFTSKFKRKKKKAVNKPNRSAEPEERTFIGIND